MVGVVLSEEVFAKLVLSSVIDRKKPAVSKREFALALRQYLDLHELSQRSFARKVGVPKSTIDDWLVPLKISEEDWEGFRTAGFTDTEIYRMLRHGQVMGEGVDGLFLNHTRKYASILKKYSGSCENVVVKETCTDVLRGLAELETFLAPRQASRTTTRTKR